MGSCAEARGAPASSTLAPREPLTHPLFPDGIVPVASFWRQEIPAPPMRARFPDGIVPTPGVISSLQETFWRACAEARETGTCVEARGTPASSALAPRGPLTHPRFPDGVVPLASFWRQEIPAPPMRARALSRRHSASTWAHSTF